MLETKQLNTPTSRPPGLADIEVQLWDPGQDPERYVTTEAHVSRLVNGSEPIVFRLLGYGLEDRIKVATH
jgi:hypothetical protein